MNKFNIFSVAVITKPMEVLTYEEADKIVNNFSDVFNPIFKNKYEKNWNAESIFNIAHDGSTHIYLVLPEIELVTDTKNFIVASVKTAMSKNFEILFSEVQHVRMVDSIKEGKDMIRDIVNALLDQTKNVH